MLVLRHHDMNAIESLLFRQVLAVPAKRQSAIRGQPSGFSEQFHYLTESSISSSMLVSWFVCLFGFLSVQLSVCPRSSVHNFACINSIFLRVIDIPYGTAPCYFGEDPIVRLDSKNP